MRLPVDELLEGIPRVKAISQVFDIYFQSRDVTRSDAKMLFFLTQGLDQVCVCQALLPRQVRVSRSWLRRRGRLRGFPPPGDAPRGGNEEAEEGERENAVQHALIRPENFFMGAAGSWLEGGTYRNETFMASN